METTDKKFFSQENNKLSIEEYLEINGELIYRTRGTSMLPIIKSGRDLVRIRKNDGKRFNKYDVVLYRRPPNKYVLHRIIEVRERDYVILGDNCISKEYGIRDEDILGVLTEIIRPGRIVASDSIMMKLYARVWYFAYPLRKSLISFLKILHPRRRIRNLKKKFGK